MDDDKFIEVPVSSQNEAVKSENDNNIVQQTKQTEKVQEKKVDYGPLPSLSMGDPIQKNKMMTDVPLPEMRTSGMPVRSLLNHADALAARLAVFFLRFFFLFLSCSPLKFVFLLIF